MLILRFFLDIMLFLFFMIRRDSLILIFKCSLFMILEVIARCLQAPSLISKTIMLTMFSTRLLGGVLELGNTR
jgi:hypothetical protein